MDRYIGGGSGLARLQLSAPLRGLVGPVDGLIKLHETRDGRRLDGTRHRFGMGARPVFQKISISSFFQQI